MEVYFGNVRNQDFLTAMFSRTGILPSFLSPTFKNGTDLPTIFLRDMAQSISATACKLTHKKIYDSTVFKRDV